MRLLLVMTLLIGCDQRAPIAPLPSEVRRDYQDGDRWCTEILSGPRAGLYCEPLDGDKEVR